MLRPGIFARASAPSFEPAAAGSRSTLMVVVCVGDSETVACVARNWAFSSEPSMIRTESRQAALNCSTNHSVHRAFLGLFQLPVIVISCPRQFLRQAIQARGALSVLCQRQIDQRASHNNLFRSRIAGFSGDTVGMGMQEVLSNSLLALQFSQQRASFSQRSANLA